MMNEEDKFFSEKARENIISYSDRSYNTSNYLAKFLLGAAFSISTTYLLLTSYTINTYSQGKYSTEFLGVVGSLGPSFFYIFTSFCIGFLIIFVYHYFFNLAINGRLLRAYKTKDTETMEQPIRQKGPYIFWLHILLLLIGYGFLITGLYEIYSELSSALDSIIESQMD